MVLDLHSIETSLLSWKILESQLEITNRTWHIHTQRDLHMLNNRDYGSPQALWIGYS